MGMSLLYQVQEPLPTAGDALRRARELLTRFADWTGEPAPEMGSVVTVEQFRHALRYFDLGVFRPSAGGPFPQDEPADFWRVVRGTGALRDGDPYYVEVALRAEFAEVWPLIEKAGLQLDLYGWADPVFAVRPDDEDCTEAELDRMVEAVGPLGFDVAWDAQLRGLPSGKLCGVQLCLNSVWTSQCTEPAPGTHAVYLSIGTRNRDVQDEWLRATGLSLGEPLLGW